MNLTLGKAYTFGLFANANAPVQLQAACSGSQEGIGSILKLLAAPLTTSGHDSPALVSE